VRTVWRQTRRIPSDLWWEMLVDGHKVVRPPPGFRELRREELNLPHYPQTEYIDSGTEAG
jgi:hypothetical protein